MVIIVDAEAEQPSHTKQVKINLTKSINHKTKKTQLSLYTTLPAPSRAAYRPSSRAGDEAPEPVVRVPRPPAEVLFVRKLDPTRPWADSKRADKVRYVPASASERQENEGA